MTEVDYYNEVRKKLVIGPITAPKHRKIIKLMKVFWNEEEIKLLSHFESADKWNSLKKLVEKTGLPKGEIKEILNRSVNKGTIDKKGLKYCLLPILPGIFERYFQKSLDTEENLVKAAKLYWDIFKEIAPHGNMINDPDWRIFRPLLPLEAEEKLIEVNEDLDVESKILPYESVKSLIDANEEFASITCQCRLIGEMSGEPCEVAPAEMGCFVVGPAGAMMVQEKVRGAKLMNKQEAIEFIKETEKRGLVHNTVFDKGYESSVFICNCCGCHCGALFPAKAFHERGAIPSNYSPKFNVDLCTKCETCVKKCPMSAIYHHFSIESDPVERMMLREELCIGCGICAANCPSDAIKMVRVRNEIPPDKKMIGNKTFLELA